MHIEDFQAYCLSKNAVEETFPFDDTTLVYKVLGKMFTASGIDDEEFSVNLKCDPEWAEELRAEYPDDIFPGWHMNKKHWNTVFFERNLEAEFLKKLIDHSYDLVVKGMRKKDRDLLANMD